MGVTHGGARRGFRSAFPARYGVSLPAPGAQGSDRALGRGQIVVSLHTEVRTLALRRARALLLATGDLFSDLRQMTKPNKPKTYSTNYEYGIEWDPTTGALKSGALQRRQARRSAGDRPPYPGAARRIDSACAPGSAVHQHPKYRRSVNGSPMNARRRTRVRCLGSALLRRIQRFNVCRGRQETNETRMPSR